MSVKEKTKHILVELKGHIPFTLMGAGLGIVFMLIFRKIIKVDSYILFTIFHPGHVILSAITTASMFRLHALKKKFFLVLIVGYFGSIGISSLSDIIIPHAGSVLFGLDIPSHAELHRQIRNNEQSRETEPGGEQLEEHLPIHLSFIEEWYLVNPAALLGVLLAYFFPRTKFPHAGHILVSTWASSSYLLMNVQSELSVTVTLAIFSTLFFAIWLPCTTSDIIFPLLLVKPDLQITKPCKRHWLHSHPHLNKSET